MKNTVNISFEDINVLRKTFKNAIDIIDSLGHNSGSVNGPDVVPKESKAQKVDKYKTLIGSGARARKPNHLKYKK